MRFIVVDDVVAAGLGLRAAAVVKKCKYWLNPYLSNHIDNLYLPVEIAIYVY